MVDRVVSIILCLLLPPVAVFLERGFGCDVIVNIILCIVGLWIGGIIHAFCVTNALGRSNWRVSGAHSFIIFNEYKQQHNVNHIPSSQIWFFYIFFFCQLRKIYLFFKELFTRLFRIKSFVLMWKFFCFVFIQLLQQVHWWTMRNWSEICARALTIFMRCWWQTSFLLLKPTLCSYISFLFIMFLCTFLTLLERLLCA